MRPGINGDVGADSEGWVLLSSAFLSS